MKKETYFLTIEVEDLKVTFEAHNLGVAADVIILAGELLASLSRAGYEDPKIKTNRID